MKGTYNQIILTDAMIQEVIHDYNKKKVAQYIPLDRQQVQKAFEYFVLFLREAILFNSVKIFHDNVLWFLRTNVKSPISETLLTEILEKMKKIVKQVDNEVIRQSGMEMIDSILVMLPLKQREQESYLLQPGVATDYSKSYLKSLLAMDASTAENLIMEALANGLTVPRIYKSIFQPVQYEIGRLWENGKVSVSEEHFCTENTRRIIASIMPRKVSNKKCPVFLGICVENEGHSLGIQMVSDYFSLDGWQAIFLGANVPNHEDLLEFIMKNNVAVIGISVTMPYYIHNVAEVIKKIRSNPSLNPIKIMVGGLAFNSYPDLYVKVGADAHARTAEEAVYMNQDLKLQAESLHE